jgi:hypothetical protein
MIHIYKNIKYKINKILEDMELKLKINLMKIIYMKTILFIKIMIKITNKKK